MKKGFTLIELLIVVVIVGVLVGVALPQYKRAAERSRATVGLAAVRQAADKVNAWYLLQNPERYPTSDEFNAMDLGDELAGVQNNAGDKPAGQVLFTVPSFTPPTTGPYLPGKIRMWRQPDWGYAVMACVANGSINSICCKADDSTCSELGLDICTYPCL